MRYSIILLAVLFTATACSSCALSRTANKKKTIAHVQQERPANISLLLEEESVDLDVDYDPEAPHKVGRLRFDMPVTDASAEELGRWVASAEPAGLDAVIIELDTPGGSVGAGQKLAKIIEESTVPVYCVADNMAASMGMYLLQSCHKRFMTKRTVLMAHEPALMIGPGDRMGMRNAQRLLDALAKALGAHICSRLTLDEKECLAKFDNGHEWWIDYEEATRINAVDGVVESTQAVVQGMRKDMKVPTI